MRIKQFFKTQRNNHVIRQVQRTPPPPFQTPPLRRYEVRFPAAAGGEALSPPVKPSAIDGLPLFPI